MDLWDRFDRFLSSVMARKKGSSSSTFRSMFAVGRTHGIGVGAILGWRRLKTHPSFDEQSG